MVYHNITPPEYRGRECAGRRSLPARELGRSDGDGRLALGVSEFNRQEPEAAGFRADRRAADPGRLGAVRAARVPALEKAYGTGTNLLFVGRLAPNKRVEDLIKAYYFYRRLDPESRLIIVVARWTPRSISRAVRSSAPSWACSTTWCSRGACPRPSLRVLPPGVGVPVLSSTGLLRPCSRRCTSGCR